MELTNATKSPRLEINSGSALTARGSLPRRALVGVGALVALCGACSAPVDGESVAEESGLTERAVVNATPSPTPINAPAGTISAISAAHSIAGVGHTSTSGQLVATSFETIDRAAAELSNKPYMTDFSGNGPSERWIVKSYDTNQALYGMNWGEDTDDPCFVEAKFRNIATGETGTARTWDECDGHTPGNLKYIALPEDYFVTGVRVCLNDDRDKVKGVQLIGQHILCVLGAEGAYTSDDGASYYQGGGMEYVLHSDPETRFTSCEELERDSVTHGHWGEHDNCEGDKDGPDSDWESVERCDSGKVATGFHFGIEAGSGDRNMIEGISLECHLAR